MRVEHAGREGATRRIWGHSQPVNDDGGAAEGEVANDGAQVGRHGRVRGKHDASVDGERDRVGAPVDPVAMWIAYEARLAGRRAERVIDYRAIHVRARVDGVRATGRTEHDPA